MEGCVIVAMLGLFVVVLIVAAAWRIQGGRRVDEGPSGPRLAAQLKGLEGPPAVFWVGESTTSAGQCQVCGAVLASDVVYCASCRTPHHEECWRYTGECSTFACRERRFSR